VYEASRHVNDGELGPMPRITVRSMRLAFPLVEWFLLLGSRYGTRTRETLQSHGELA